MEVILREDVTGLGIIGDVVRVKPGYARNYLLPRGLAVPADSRNLRQLEHHKRIIAAKKARERGSVEHVANNMQGTVLETEARAGRGGKLFGSVTNIDVCKLLAEKSFEIDRRRIEIKEPIKEIGDYEVLVRVGQDVTATVKVVVKPLGGELEDKSVDGDDEPPVAPIPQVDDEFEASDESGGGEACSPDDAGSDPEASASTEAAASEAAAEPKAE